MHHPHILSFLGYYEDAINFSIVLEYAPKGDLLAYMKNVADKDRLKKARQIMWQVCQAAEFLQDIQVAHRDIKPENIVVCCQDIVKLCDFGWAVWWKPGQRQSTLCGTAEYVPPEMLSHGKNNKMSYAAEYVDRWMLGVLALELVHTSTPFCPTESNFIHRYDEDDDDDSDIISAIIFAKIRGFRSIALDVVVDDDNNKSKYYSENPDYCDFVASLMQVEPAERLSASKAVGHCFFVPSMRRKPVKVQPTVAQRRQLFESAH